MTVRVIPRLDIKGPNLVKGLSFDGYRVLGTAERFSILQTRYIFLSCFKKFRAEFGNLRGQSS